MPGAQAPSSSEAELLRSDDYKNAIKIILAHQAEIPEVKSALAEFDDAVSAGSQRVRGFTLDPMALVAIGAILTGAVDRFVEWLVDRGWLPAVFGDFLPDDLPEFIKKLVPEQLSIGWTDIFLAIGITLLAFWAWRFAKRRQARVTAAPRIDPNKIGAAGDKLARAIRRSAPSYSERAFRCLGDFEACCGRSPDLRVGCVVSLLVCYAAVLNAGK